MLANMTAYVVARHWRPTPIYEALLEQDGIHLSSRHANEDGRASACEQFTKGHPAVQPSAWPRRPGSSWPAADEPDPRGLAGGRRGGQIVDIITPDEIAILAAEPELLRAGETPPT